MENGKAVKVLAGVCVLGVVFFVGTMQLALSVLLVTDYAYIPITHTRTGAWTCLQASLIYMLLAYLCLRWMPAQSIRPTPAPAKHSDSDSEDEEQSLL